MVIFNKSAGKCESEFWFKEEEIQVVDKIKYLGYIFFQSNGRYGIHIQRKLSTLEEQQCFQFSGIKSLGIKNLSLHKRVFLSRVMPVLHYEAEILGHEKAAQLESIQLGYFKRFFGLHRTTHCQFLNGRSRYMVY